MLTQPNSISEKIKNKLIIKTNFNMDWKYIIKVKVGHLRGYKCPNKYDSLT